MKILIAGRSGTGKDTIARLLKSKGLTDVLSTTTRPPRFEGEATHRFVDEETAEKELPNAVAKTKINNYHYYATREQVEDNDIYIIDPCGIYELIQNMPDTSFMIVYMQADLLERKKRACMRADNPMKEEMVFDERTHSEDAQFSEFEEILDNIMQDKTKDETILPVNVTSLYVFTNEFNPDQMTDLAADIYKRFTVQKQITAMLQVLYDKEFIVKKDGKPGLCDTKGNLLSMDVYADSIYTNPEQVMNITHAYALACPDTVTSPENYRFTFTETKT